MEYSSRRGALLWAALGTVFAYMLQGIPAIGWYVLNTIRVPAADPGPRWLFPTYFWVDPVWVGALAIYAAVLFLATRRGLTTRRMIAGSASATLIYLLAVAVLPATTWENRDPWPFPIPVTVFFSATLYDFNGWVLVLAPLIAWLPTRAILDSSNTRRENRVATSGPTPPTGATRKRPPAAGRGPDE